MNWEQLDWQESLRELIKSEIDRGKKENAEFSMRKFAKHLDISPALISRFLSRELEITPVSAKKIVFGLTRTQKQRDFYLAAMGEPITRKTEALPAEGRFLLSHWLCTAVLFYFDLPEEQRSIQKMARKLAVSEEEIKNAIQVLIEKNFLLQSESGALSKGEIHWNIGDGPAVDEEIRNFHSQNLSLSQKALSTIDRSRRHFSNMTVSGNEELLRAAIAELEASLEKVSALMDGAPSKDQIYRVSVSIFPLDFNPEGTL